MLARLSELRGVLLRRPRLEGGRWWAALGGLHMNVHKLLENVLFECELYLGRALVSSSDAARRWAEDNLDGCYAKRTLEAAKFMWRDAMKRMLDGDDAAWAEGQAMCARAAEKKEGWGWGVNNGDIWAAGGAAALVRATRLWASTPPSMRARLVGAEVGALASEARTLLERARERSPTHPWTLESLRRLDALDAARGGPAKAGAPVDAGALAEEARDGTFGWMSRILGATKPRSRIADAEKLRKEMPGAAGASTRW
jgi:hypothetical protein